MARAERLVLHFKAEASGDPAAVEAGDLAVAKALLTGHPDLRGMF